MRYLILILGVIGFLSTPAPTLAQSVSLDGDWATDWGPSTVYRISSGYFGTYQDDNGRFELYPENGVWAGIWAEDQSANKCDSARMGSYYWGRLLLDRQVDAGGFAIRWGYCANGTLDRNWSFNGKTGTEAQAVLTDPALDNDLSGTDSSGIGNADGIAQLSGEWKTAWGAASVHSSDQGFVGTYEDDDGQFELYPGNGVWTGIWAESQSGQKCDTARLGSYYWGRLLLDMAVDTGGFTIRWGYCGGGDVDRDWRFERKTSVEQLVTLPGEWKTAWGNTSVYFNDSGFVGTYLDDGGNHNDDGQFELYPGNGGWTGYWAEPLSNNKCDTARMGTYYWGRLLLDMAVDTDGFTMRWGYCENGSVNRDWRFQAKIR